MISETEVDKLTVRVYENRLTMGKAAADIIVARLNFLLAGKDRVNMIFAAAPSQNEFLDFLAQDKQVDWTRIYAFHMDEYMGLNHHDQQSFGYFLRNKIFDKLPFGGVHFINGKAEAFLEAQRYTELLKQYPPDLVCLGIGENTHIAFNDPHTADFNDEYRVKSVELDPLSRIQQVNDGCFPDLGHVPEYALTLTVPVLLAADNLYCIVPGENKSRAVFATLKENISEKYPSTILRRHPNCILFLDVESAGLSKNLLGMNVYSDTVDIACVDCISGVTKNLFLLHGDIKTISEINGNEKHLPFVGPGLVDLQINGVNGIDFNMTTLIAADILIATRYLLSKGVTTYLPTIITNSEENMICILDTFRRACDVHPIVNECVGGIHLEGPFISPLSEVAGAHDKKYVRAPDWPLLEKFQHASGGRIKMVTIAPEWEGAIAFIKKCRKAEILVAIGHSMASHNQIKKAVDSGAMLSTHLGNGVPLQLPRHPNIIWDQLAEEELYVSLIADGIHVPDSFIKVVMLAKAGRLVLVSDATCFAGMAAGEYSSHIGNTIILNADQRISVKDSPGLLAGSAKILIENIGYLISRKLASLQQAWPLASVQPAALLKRTTSSFTGEKDMVIFRMNNEEIAVEQVIKNNRLVYRSND
jgi:glucosamine-6-phosphate deaminase